MGEEEKGNNVRILNLTNLELRAPENLTVVHTTLIGAVNNVQKKLKNLELEFYGPDSTAEDEIRRWVVPVSSVLRAMRLRCLNCAGQIDDIIEYMKENHKKETVSVYDIKRLKECLKRVMDAVPSKFNKIMQDLRRILAQIQKYCLSFYSDKSPVYLDTAHNYEKQHTDYLSEINRSMERITGISNKFNGPGITLNHFSEYSQELARKTDCKNIPFLLLFPEACEDTKDVCSIMNAWIAADANYATFLANDIIDLDQSKQELAKVVRDHQDKFHKMNFRLKYMRNDHSRLGTDLTKLKQKEDELLVDEERLAMETNEIQVEIEMKEYRRDEIMKNSKNMQTNALYDQYSVIVESLRALKSKLPFQKRQLDAVRHKLSYIKDKRKEIEELEKELKTIEEDMIELEVAKFTKERDLRNVNSCLDFARQLHMYKNSSDTVNKIFYDQPVATTYTKRLSGRPGKEEPFERVCFLVATEIEHAWPQLYRHLPFSPTRGNNTIDRDISELSVEESRDGTETTAVRAIAKWRRHHTRAKIEDVKEALIKIDRLDIVRHLEDLLDPSRKVAPPVEKKAQQQEGIYATIDPYLLPFLKEVERFDELRAANKI